MAFLMFIQKYGPWIFKRKAIIANKCGKQSGVYYAPDWHRTKYVHFKNLLLH